jgi:hypothetical protein
MSRPNRSSRVNRRAVRGIVLWSAVALVLSATPARAEIVLYHVSGHVGSAETGDPFWFAIGWDTAELHTDSFLPYYSPWVEFHGYFGDNHVASAYQTGYLQVERESDSMWGERHDFHPGSLSGSTILDPNGDTLVPWAAWVRISFAPGALATFDLHDAPPLPTRIGVELRHYNLHTGFGELTFRTGSTDVRRVPEPGTLALLTMGLTGAAMAVRRGRRRPLR